MLYHLSDSPDIKRFEPRVPPSASSGVREPVVWAVDERLLHNYLLPRDCPRVTFYATPKSDPADVERLMGGGAPFVVAIEAAWMPALRAATLYQYALPPETFAPVDEGAGYYVSRVGVTPLAVTVIDDLLTALLARGVELRVLPSLWPLRERVIASSLQFSLIRMRNAQPPAAGYDAWHPL
ncbi:MAG: hypothetical protein H7Y32_03540 [Chloroflexales bacterium]|nr:hypothetical protein [Chloroflexales bacterium]